MKNKKEHVGWCYYVDVHHLNEVETQKRSLGMLFVAKPHNIQHMIMPIMPHIPSRVTDLNSFHITKSSYSQVILVKFLS